MAARAGTWEARQNHLLRSRSRIGGCLRTASTTLPQRGVSQCREQARRAYVVVHDRVRDEWGWSQGYGAGAYDGVLACALLGGGFGVFLFFALSGYLLFLPFARATWGEGAPRFALLLESFSAETVAKVVPPVWSLVVEVQFYVLLPVLAVTLAAVAGRSVSRAIGVVLGLTLALWLLRVATVTSVEPSALWRYSLPAKACFFGPGLLLALLRVRWESGPPGSTTRSRLAEPAVWITGAGLLTALVSGATPGTACCCRPASCCSGPPSCRCARSGASGGSGGARWGSSASRRTASTCGVSRSSGCWHRPPGCRMGSGCSCSRAASRRSCSRW